MVRMKVEIVGIDQMSMLPVVILTDIEERGFLPLVIGPAEASAISLGLERQKPPRPLTHDLLLSTIEHLSASVERVVITDLVEDTYYAKVFLKSDNRELAIDARPSDSIALALRSDSPIFISEQVASKALIAQPIDDSEMEDFRKFLDNLTPEDFRKQWPD